MWKNCRTASSFVLTDNEGRIKFIKQCLDLQDKTKMFLALPISFTQHTYLRVHTFAQ